MSDKQIGPDAVALAILIERTHGHRTPPPAMSFDQVNMICEMLRKAGEEVLRHAALFDAAVDVAFLMDDTAKQDSGAYRAFQRLEAAIAAFSRPTP